MRTSGKSGKMIFMSQEIGCLKGVVTVTLHQLDLTS